MLIFELLSGGPASSSRTLDLGFFDKRFANAQPALPAPMMIYLYLFIWRYSMRQIIAIGGGGFGRTTHENHIEQYILDQSSKSNPNILFIPTASACLLYTSPSPRDRTRSRMPSSA